jgi:DNA helicase-2/ATP-dependent DNA helicase PcrA
MIGISKQVQALVAQGVACGNIGIIYKENKYGEELATYLRQLKLPVYSKRSLNILELPLARKLILTLRYLVAEHDVPYSGDEMLFEILHFDWWQVPPMEIARLSLEVAERGSAGQRGSIRQALAERSDAPPKDLFNTGIHPGLRQASVVLESLIAALPNTTLLELTEKLIRETGVLARILRSENKHGQLQVLTGLFDFIREEARRRPLMRPEGLVGLLDLMIKENIRLPMVQVSGNDKGINLMTVHGSKGLEFEYVFVAGCNAGFWETKRGPNKEYKLPDTLFNAATSGSDLEELRRLFYVALTRAEQHLILSYTQFKDDGKEMEPSLFIAEIIDKNKLPVETQLVDTEVASEFTSLFFAAGAPEIERMEEEVIGRTLERFVMNVTALNNYLNCPLEFYFRNLIRIPAPKNEATEFGSAVHHALERLFRKMQDSGTETFPTKEEFIADFEWYMHRHRESFTREQFERRMEYGREVLPNYYLRRIAGFNKIVAIERNLRHIVVDGIPLKGKLDKLEFNGHDVNVVDYKTGDPAKAIPRTKPPTDKAPLGGDYWRQAVFYKILVDRYEQRNWNVVSSEFDFIEPDAKKEYRTIRVNIRPEDIQTVMEQVRTVWQRIQDRDFYTGCGKEKCHWCHFVKTNQLTVAIHQTDDPDAAE